MHRRRQAAGADPSDTGRDRAARLSGEIPIVPREQPRPVPPGPPVPRPPAPGEAPTTRAPVPGPPGPPTPDPSSAPRRAPLPGGPATAAAAPASPTTATPTTATPTTATPAGPAPTGGPAPQRPSPARPTRATRAAGPADAAEADGATRRTTRPPAGRKDPERPGAKGGKKKSRTPDPARRTLGAALGLTAASTVLPGTGHLAMRRRRTGGLVLGTIVTVVVVGIVLLLALNRSTLLTNLLSTTALTTAAVALVVAGIAWIAVVARTYALARPRNMPLGRKILGTGTAALLCLTVAVPFGYAVDLVNSQRGLLDSLFKGGGKDAAVALDKPRLNILLLGSDAGPDRTGTRTDSMMLASIDTRGGRTTLFSLPRNIQRAEFPPGSPMAAKFPKGFHDPNDPLSGNFLLNAIYAYGEQNPQVAPTGPTPYKGLNLLQQSISYMTGIPIDYYLEINMAGFSSMVDAVGGVTVNVGPDPIPVGGVTAFGKHVTPDRYIQPGTQTLNGEDALWFARSRRNGNDYQRMGRQRCLIQAVINQKSPTELLARFQAIAAATKNTVDTDMPQQVLPALAVLADSGFRLESVAFDPTLPDPNGPNGQFDTSNPDVPYMQQVVQKAITDPPPDATPAPAAPPTSAPPSSTGRPSATPAPSPTQAPSAAPQSVQDACASVAGTTAPGGTDEDQTDGAGGADGAQPVAADDQRHSGN